ncbi:MAG TPA: ABC transporter permease [Dehalococcoidia bacterium]|nr:ABC transporter permease [Dehalococcoidia bacterium]
MAVIQELPAPGAMAVALPQRPGFARYIVYYLRRKPLGTAGLAIVLTLVIAGVFAPWLAPYPYAEQHYDALRQAPSLEYPLGTDQFGRDQLSRLIHGARISLMVGFLSVIIGTGFGAFIGLISGYFMGRLDAIVQRVVDMWMSFPDLILALTIVAVFGNTIPNVILAISATILPRGVRVIRASTIALRETDYVLATRAVGASNARIMLRHILPNAMAPFLIIMSSMFGNAILTEAGLSYLGLGIAEPFPSWGRMLTGTAAQFAVTAPWIILFPGLAISITVLGFAFAGDALRDLFDPKLRGR